MMKRCYLKPQILRFKGLQSLLLFAVFRFWLKIVQRQLSSGYSAALKCLPVHLEIGIQGKHGILCSLWCALGSMEHVIERIQ